MAKSIKFPVPLLAVSYQQLISGLGKGTWSEYYRRSERWETYSPEQLVNEITAKSDTVNKIGFIGLGAMGFGMATHLLRSNFSVLVYKPTLSRFANAGGLVGNSPAEVSKDVDVLVIMVTNEAQAESVLYGDFGAVPALPTGASIILSSTVSLRICYPTGASLAK
ncbi:hypothetical protein L1049_027237 [Liquidambar formosana]|uniref:6-phosphogluconate dehydrogenase NADP-binding domain-containing protein n=1 Tax=Liquidambar formosana TaxID=63359 RepID=A0AAP0R348_LIQFO